MTPTGVRDANHPIYSSDAMLRSCASASRLSRNALGIGTPWARRSCNFRAWLCSPGRKMRSTPGSRFRITDIADHLVDAALESAGRHEGRRSAIAAMAWPVLVAFAGVFDEADHVVAERGAIERAGQDTDDQAQPGILVIADREQRPSSARFGSVSGLPSLGRSSSRPASVRRAVP